MNHGRWSAASAFFNSLLEPGDYGHLSIQFLTTGRVLEKAYGALADCLKQGTCAPGFRSFSLCRYVRHDTAGYNALVDLLHRMGVTVDPYPQEGRDPNDIMLLWPSNLEYVAKEICIFRDHDLKDYREKERDDCNDVLDLVRASKADTDLNIGFRMDRFFDSGNRCKRLTTNVAICSWGGSGAGSRYVPSSAKEGLDRVQAVVNGCLAPRSTSVTPSDRKSEGSCVSYSRRYSLNVRREPYTVTAAIQSCEQSPKNTVTLKLTSE
jgi:hypothetical protein